MDSILAQCHVPFQALNMTSLLSCSLFTIVFCSQEDNSSKETLVTGETPGEVPSSPSPQPVCM